MGQNYSVDCLSADKDKCSITISDYVIVTYRHQWLAAAQELLEEILNTFHLQSPKISATIVLYNISNIS